jgi:predicted PurR-regulated permease PerM
LRSSADADGLRPAAIFGVYAADAHAFRMKENGNAARLSTLATFATLILIVVIFRWAREVIIPLALAGLLAFLLSPMVVRLTRWGLGRTLAVILTVTLALAVFVGAGWVVTRQVLNVVQRLPRYEANIEAKVTRLHQPEMPPALAEAAGMVAKIQKDLKASDASAVATPGAGPVPVPVEVELPGSSMFQMTQSLLLSLFNPLATAAIVLVLLAAMLMQWEDLHARFVKVTNSGSFTLPSQALEDAAQRVSRYLSMQLVVNATYGVPIGLGLYFIGIPNALLWGCLSTLLRFIPYLGPWIAAAFPVALALAIDPGWTKLAWTLGLYVVAEAVTANIIEVWVYGLRTGISSLGLMLAAIFWTWLWGPVGLFLSTPLTVCLVVLGKYLPGLKVFNTLLCHEEAPKKVPKVRHFSSNA